MYLTKTNGDNKFCTCKLSRKSTIAVERSQSHSEQVKVQVQGESFSNPTPCMSSNFMFMELAANDTGIKVVRGNYVV